MSHKIGACAIHLLAALSLTACGGGTGSGPGGGPRPDAGSPAHADMAGIAQARADSIRRPYTEADVRFMTSMIGHHAQAIEMARLAPTHGASPSVRTLAARIVNSQRDEIASMQQWLSDRRRPVPEVAEDGTVTLPGPGHGMHGAGHAAQAPMAGMLTAAQLEELDAARGREFDRLFLSYMIQHHRGALAMVEELFGTHGAAQDETVFKLASDINVDQITEIERMQRMLVEVILSPT